MRGAAVLALGLVVGLCLLFLVIVIPLRALVNPSPVVAESPAPTLLVVTLPPTPEPTPMIPSVLTFDESVDNPMPVKENRLPLGKGYRLRGTVQSNYPLLSVSISINCAL